jgi:tetratricopeptide (TPR) repeat protein
MMAAITPEEYAEPRCPLGKPVGRGEETVPQRRILEKLDEYLDRRDYAGAERHLLYWMEEALQCRDDRGRLMIANELIGHYRKQGQRDKAFARIAEALELLETLSLTAGETAGTTCVNAATACSAFGEDERALELFVRARGIYESLPQAAPELLGGLYNNMGLTLTALGRFAEAFQLYDKALAEMEKTPDGTLERAITCLNMADAWEACGAAGAEEKIGSLLDRAYALLLDPAPPRDGYYAFVCEKCAPGFAHYGYAEAAQELTDLAEKIYAGT